MKEHLLKTWPCYFEAVQSGLKTFEIRKDDRGFEVGDLLILEEYIPLEESIPDSGRHTGRQVYMQISYLTRFEQKPGYVVMGIKPEGTPIK